MVDCHSIESATRAIHNISHQFLADGGTIYIHRGLRYNYCLWSGNMLSQIDCHIGYTFIRYTSGIPAKCTCLSVIHSVSHAHHPSMRSYWGKNPGKTNYQRMRREKESRPAQNATRSIVGVFIAQHQQTTHNPSEPWPAHHTPPICPHSPPIPPHLPLSTPNLSACRNSTKVHHSAPTTQNKSCLHRPPPSFPILPYGLHLN